MELFRRAGVEAMADKVLPPKGSSKGLTQGQMVESFILLSAPCGECVNDLLRLRNDPGLESMLGYWLPAPETGRQWLDKFHDESLLAQKPLQGSFIPPESKALTELREVNKRVIQAYAQASHPNEEVTFDVDAQLRETAKSGVEYCYEGYKAFQPMQVCWAEPCWR